MKLLPTLMIFLSYVIQARAQDTTYFDSKGIKTFCWDSAYTYNVVIKKNNGRQTNNVFYKSGQPISSVQMKAKDFDGSLITYWSNGNIKRSDIYENNKFISGKCFDENGNQIKHFDFEISPQFPGGNEQLHNYIYKRVNQWNTGSVKGIILVNFVVMKDGSISEIKIIEGINKELDEKAIKLVSNMPKWNAGQQDGNKVNVLFNLPIRINSYSR